MIYNNPKIYTYYKEKGGVENYNTHRKICADFNMEVFNRLLEGERFHPGKYLGYIEVLRIERSYKRPTVNLCETMKLRREGIKDTVYWTDDFYFRYLWKKSKAKIKNKHFYEFKPTRGLKGNTTKLVDLLQKDPTAYTRFRTFYR